MNPIDIPVFYPNYSTLEKQRLIELQTLIHQVADESHLELVESSKWGQLSFATPQGTPIRIDKLSDTEIGCFVHCQTNLIETWRSLFADTLTFSKNRAIVLRLEEPFPVESLKICIDQAFYYHMK